MDYFLNTALDNLGGNEAGGLTAKKYMPLPNVLGARSSNLARLLSLLNLPLLCRLINLLAGRALGTLGLVTAQQGVQPDLSLDVLLRPLILHHARDAEELVHLLQRPTLGLGQEEVDV